MWSFRIERSHLAVFRIQIQRLDGEGSSIPDQREKADRVVSCSPSSHGSLDTQVLLLDADDRSNSYPLAGNLISLDRPYNQSTTNRVTV